VIDYGRHELTAELIRDEGEKLRAYRDSLGNWSIGVGRNLDGVGIRPDETRALGITTASCRARGITQPQSRALLANDIAAAENALDGNLAWWRSLTPARQRVLLNMCFNMGIKKLLGFHATLAAVQTGCFGGAARHMLDSLWARQVGIRAKRLAKMMETGAAA
jgi:lysozyme